MPTEIVIAGVVVRFYGLLVGLGLVVAAMIAERRLRAVSPESSQWFWDMISVGVVGGLIGARLWHVATDWPLYAVDPVSGLYIWRGGMSILGGLVGGVAALVLGRQIFVSWKQVPLVTVLDALVLGVPVGQAIGRLGNWVNQEVIGLPTELPWKIAISPDRRPAGFEQFEHFHPLFAYEAVALVLLAILLHHLTLKNPRFALGSGAALALYLTAYGWLRFFLEFVRIEKAMLPIGLGVNQVIVGIVAMVASYWLVQILKRETAGHSRSTA